MSRRYLNVVAQEFRIRLYSLHRIDLSKHLFYTDSEVAASLNKNKRGVMMDGWKNLPPPSINFQPAPSSLDARMAYAFSLLGGEDNILYSDPRCRAAVYSADSDFLEHIPSPSGCKTLKAISFRVTQANHPAGPVEVQPQYILDLSEPDTSSCFEVLSHRQEGWRWDVLPPPPFAGTVPDTCSYAVVNGSAICISPFVDEKGLGTYTFDTVHSSWRRAADWALPFFGKAEYVPELNLWFALSGRSPSSSLCAFDLSAMDSSRQPPIPLHTWDYLGLPRHKKWLPTQLHLLNLGLGKFCVATLFGTWLWNCSYSISDEEDMDGEEYAVFTGLEVKRSNDGPLQLIRHKSKRYAAAGRCNIQCVL